jgi:hypothetical protein
MQTAHELLSRAEEFQVLASKASNPLAKAQWSIMAQDYRRPRGSLRHHDYLSGARE